MSGDAEKKPKVGLIVPGQNWVELHGSFTYDQLLKLAKEVKKQHDLATNGNKN